MRQLMSQNRPHAPFGRIALEDERVDENGRPHAPKRQVARQGKPRLEKV